MATKNYKGFVSIQNKQCWTKNFNKKELSQLESIFNDNFRKYSNNFNLKNDYLNILKVNPKIIHMETDIFDDTLGVKPRTIKNFIDKFNIDLLITFLDILTEDILTEHNIFNDTMLKDKKYSFYSETNRTHFLNFNKIFKLFLSKKILSEEYLINCKENIDKKNKLKKIKEDFDKEIENISFGKFFYDKLSDEKKENLLLDFEKDSVLKVNSLLSSQIEDWQKTHSFVPNVIEMFYLNASEFDKKSFLNLLYSRYKTKQFQSLEIEDRIYFIQLYKIFGKSLEHIRMDLLSNQDFDFKLFENIKFNESKSFDRILSKMFNGIIPDMSLTDLARIKLILSVSKKVDNLYCNKKEFFHKDIDLLLDFNKDIFEKIPEKNKDIIQYLLLENKNTIKNIFELGEKNYQTVFELFMKNKDNECNLPNIVIYDKEYTLELIRKDSFKGYIAAYPFTCQYIGGQGDRFTRFGYEDINSSFVIISKKDEIICQSWVWIKNNQLTFDSIDKKGNVNSNSIKPLYDRLSTKLLEELDNIDIITSGNNPIYKEVLTDHEIQDKIDNCYDSSKQYLVKRR